MSSLLSRSLVLATLAACSHPQDVHAVYAAATPGAGAVDVVLNSASDALTVSVDDQLVVDRMYSRKAHIEGVPAGPAHVRVATGGNCEQGAWSEHDVTVPVGGTATITLPGPEPNTACGIFEGLWYIGANVGIVAIAIALAADEQVKHLTHVK